MKLSADEKAAGQLTQESLSLAVEQLRDEGFVVLEGVLPEATVNSLRAATCIALGARYEDCADELKRTGNHGGVHLPLQMPFIDPLVIENPMVFQVLRSALGERFFGCLPYGCNSVYPGSNKQNVHRDCGHIFPEVRTPLPPLMIAANIALDDFTIENGATEIWPATHKQVDRSPMEIATLRIPPEQYSDRKSVQTAMTAGSIVLRDMRTWHRAMPNSTDRSRTMLAIVYYRQYFMPDNLSNQISAEELDLFSERSKWIYRLRH